MTVNHESAFLFRGHMSSSSVNASSGAAGHVHLHDGQPVAHGVSAAQAEFLRKHRGHEQLHAALLAGMLAFLLAAQLGLVVWKKRSPKSFQLVTLVGMVALPPLYAVYHAYWRFTVIWLLFMGVSGYFLSLPFVQRPMQMTTPRRVYWFFFLSNKVALGLAAAGYALILVDAMSGKVWGLGYFAVMLLFYGLFYGVIVRDLAALCADKMAQTLGYDSKGESMPNRVASARVCAICAETLQTATEDVITLPSCGHDFHSFCIRGWRIVGKDECPRCREKVELGHVFAQPWEKQSVVFTYILDVTRYLIVWNPVIFGVSTYVIRMIDH